MITGLGGKELSFMEQTSNGVTNGGPAVQRDVVACLYYCQVVVVEGGDRADHHATADDTIRRTRFNGEAQWQERDGVEGIVGHRGGAKRGWQGGEWMGDGGVAWEIEAELGT